MTTWQMGVGNFRYPQPDVDLFGAIGVADAVGAMDTGPSIRRTSAPATRDPASVGPAQARPNRPSLVKGKIVLRSGDDLTAHYNVSPFVLKSLRHRGRRMEVFLRFAH